MASLDKLAIRGIRSFDSDKTQVIQFYSPVTLIVGVNGTGKTTIIECLKYATTGELPPNTKGGAFIHDPKIANQKEVKAQVRLRFKSVNGDKWTATRNLQVTVKKGGALTMKTLEGLLAKADGDPDKRNAISTKCAEMDLEVPRLMGVSRAILDNVIFCHQEESNWPLSEPSALKKKFDDIFEASKFTKALDHIKILRKDRTADLKVENERLQHAKKERERFDKATSDWDAHKIKLSQREKTAEELEEEVSRLARTNQEFYNSSAKFTEVFTKVDGLQTKRNGDEEFMKDIRSRTKLLKEDDAKLKEMKDNFDRDMADLQTRKREKEEQMQADNDDLLKLRSDLKVAVGKLGGFQNDRKNYDANADRRQNAVKSKASALGISGYDSSDLSPAKVTEFCDLLSDMVKKASTDAETIKTNGEREDRATQIEINRLTNEKSNRRAVREEKQRQMAKSSDEVRRLENLFESVSTIDIEIKNLERDIKESEQSKINITDELANADFASKIQTINTDLRSKDAKRESLESELSSLQAQGDVRAKLAVKREELKAKEDEIDIAIEAHKGKYLELLGSNLIPDEMENALSNAIRTKEFRVTDAETAHKTVSDQYQHLQASLDLRKKDLKDKESELSRLEKALKDGMSGHEGTVEEAITAAEEEVTYRESEKVMLGSQAALFKGIKAKGATHSKCLGCNRAIRPSEKPAFEAYVEAQIVEGNPGPSKKRLEEAEKELAVWKGEAAKLRRLLPIYENIKTLREDTIPSLQETINKDEKRKSSTADEVDSTKDTLLNLKSTLRELGQLKTAAVVVSRNLRGVEDVKLEIAGLERTLESTGSTKTVSEVQQDIKGVKAEIKSLELERQTVSSERDQLQTRLRNAETQLQNRNLQMAQSKLKAQSRKDTETRLEDQKQRRTALNEELNQIDSEMTSFETPLRQHEEKLKQSRSSWNGEYQTAQERLDGLRKSEQAISTYTERLQTYAKNGGDKNLRDAEATVKDQERQIVKSEEDIQKLQSQISGLQSDIANADQRRTQISDNIRFRQHEKRVAELNAEIDTYDLEEAHRARTQFNQRYAASEKLRTDKHAKHQQLVGEISGMKEAGRRMQSELKQYEGAQANYLESLVKWKTGTMANNDLEKYAKALDNAIMKFHSMKMEEVNDVIGHLWRKTYTGTDIDGIKIRSDHDEGSTAARKVYNYRVVMLKDRVELDMRGRCSAGQKVLASIIIRLALADSFAQSCGVLALDEPTTNLDQENVDSLATSLAELINERRHNSNFQLVVITHDEGFLQKLAQADVFQNYWRVFRDDDQKSVVERQRVVAD